MQLWQQGMLVTVVLTAASQSEKYGGYHQAYECFKVVEVLTKTYSKGRGMTPAEIMDTSERATAP